MYFNIYFSHVNKNTPNSAIQKHTRKCEYVFMKKNELTYRIGRRIVRLRKEKQLNQEEFAEIAGKIVNTISKIERGVCDPQLSSLDACAKALGMDLGQLISDAIYTPLNNSPYFNKIIDLLKDKDDKTLSMVYDIVKTVLNAKNLK